MNIPDKAVEAAAKWAYGTMNQGSPLTPWEHLSPSLREETMAHFRPIIAAAAPHIAEQAWDEGFNIGWDAARGEPEEPNPYREEVGE